MALFLFRFFPVLLPLLSYLIWLYVIRHRARKSGEELPKFSDGPIFWIIMASLGIAVICFIVMGFSNTSHNKGSYQPAHMEGDKLMPPKVGQ